MKTTTSIQKWTIATAVCVACCSDVLADEDIPVKEVPPAVTEAIQAKFPGAEILSAEKGTNDGKPYFEVQIRDKEGRWEVEVSPVGKILDIDKED